MLRTVGNHVNAITNDNRASIAANFIMNSRIYWFVHFRAVFIGGVEFHALVPLPNLLLSAVASGGVTS